MPIIQPKFSGVDPFNAKDWTLDEMRKDQVMSLWLRFIEPRVVSFGNEENACWVWDMKKRQHDPTKWSPQVWASLNPDVANPKYKLWSVRRFVACLFWTFPDNYQVFRRKDVCTHPGCIRPLHLEIKEMNFE